MKILFTPTARLQFLGALEYVRKDNPSAARNFRIKTGKILKRLVRFAQSGRRLPEFPDLSFREVIVNPYRFFYLVKGRIVWVVAVWHSAQYPEKP